MNPDKLSIYAVGDVAPDRPNPESLFELAVPTLREADILVLATPVYIPLPGEMQNLINRLCPLVKPKLETREGRTRARFHDEVRIQRIALVSTGGWWEKGNFGTVGRIAQELAESASVKFAGALLRPHAGLMRRQGELTRFLKFCAVGLSGVLVNMGLLWLLTEVAGLFYLLSAAISIETSIISNFLLNDYFTFPDRRSPRAKSFLNRLLKFNLVSLAGLGLNMGVLWLLTEVFGLYYLLSNLCGIAVATLWNYLVNTWWTWK